MPETPAAAPPVSAFVLFVRAAHAVCDALEARDAPALYTAALALCVARARARAEEAALERAFDLPRRRPERP